MKYCYDILVLVIFGCFVGSCTRDNPVDIMGEKVTVDLYKCTAGTARPILCFDSLIEDSRCPEGAVCIWGGRAVIQVRFLSEGMEHQFNMAIPRIKGSVYTNDTTINGYQIIFQDLIPRPLLTGTGNHVTKKAVFLIRRL